MSKGSYVILMRNEKDRIIQVGKRRVYFRKGYYIYCGSHMVNLEKRIKRHFSRDKKLRWHIDYLTKEMDVLFAIMIRSGKKMECSISRVLCEEFEPYSRLGASDCKCKTHVFFSDKKPDLIPLLNDFGEVEYITPSF
ncbi:hypothetical protein Asulf_01112 [Archaeoglobus sulfaticallidus PM70-1]|uniref:GIY-YIG domain-containing protein n=1 Tax=Archaeoglobus sulfaticallidus PM70-1 TaxID=387631 RepID=N0BFR0_9EURY|nr:GIY-YIG nuclease family protein [Archaeoglobus sulfaticallidus]AGK61112.1 hypothetical protein Asulf_01112 [Archaeoglobus sulfaticallidus PM70-1]